MQGEQIAYVNQMDEENQLDGEGFINENFIDNSSALQRFKEFLPNFSSNGNNVYYDMLYKKKQEQKYYLTIELGDLNDYDPILSSSFQKDPTRYTPIFEQAINEYTQTHGIDKQNRDWQVQFVSQQQPLKLRELRHEFLNKLITIQGIMVSVTQPYQKAKTIQIKCANCEHTMNIETGAGLESVILPAICQRQQNQDLGAEQCPKDSYVIMPHQSQIIDQQFCKIQESNKSIPTGEIPRTFSVSLDRYNIDKVVPGQQVIATGIYKILERKQIANKGIPSSLKLPYLQILGIQVIDKTEKIQFSEEDVNQIRAFKDQENFFEKISKNIAPAIFGRENIKQAIACLLFGGSKKQLPDKTKLKGDINVLLIGDPSTGKSQFLKFVDKLSSVSVYTSGKGSSAAGLTASVVKNYQTGEFQIEGGAFVLADGGIVCIDEFDKMRPEDRVAIHEAMEQQTISISKAGFTTKLNSRCSVLAAANPIFGSYSEYKDISEQIELQTTILSRFDTIFIVKDPKERQHDAQMVDHILNLHSNQQDAQQQNNPDLIDITLFQKYISYAKQNIDPRLSQESSQKIINLYVNDREKAKESGASKAKKAHIPITVRQLEALIRLSESVAKIHLSEEVLPEHIDIAHKLFTESTMNAIGKAGNSVGLNQNPENIKLVSKIELAIKQQIAINGRKKLRDLKQAINNTFNNEAACEQAIHNLIGSEEFKSVQQNTVLQRIK